MTEKGWMKLLTLAQVLFWTGLGGATYIAIQAENFQTVAFVVVGALILRFLTRLARVLTAQDGMVYLLAVIGVFTFLVGVYKTIAIAIDWSTFGLVSSVAVLVGFFAMVYIDNWGRAENTTPALTLTLF